MVRVAVIGGGLFGCMAAIELARTGVQVDLFEAEPDVLIGATQRNQARLHRGYHYPRSDATAAAARDGFVEFTERYFPAIVQAQHHYVVAPSSKVTPDQYLAFCDRLNLPYEVVNRPIHVHTGDLVVRVPEAFLDVYQLRRLLRRDLAAAGVDLRLSQRVQPSDLGSYDIIVEATYGQPWSKPLRYEVCEVALLELGRYSGESYVVIDGEFVSLDPFRKLYVLYDVKHSVHAVAEGDATQLWLDYGPILRRWGPVRTSLSRVDLMRESASRFLWDIEPHGLGVSIYHGSWFSIRAVLPDVDATDERPTLVERSGNVVSVLSGKMSTALAAARSVKEAVLA